MTYYMSDRHKAAIKRWADKNPHKQKEYQKKYYDRKKREDPRKFYAKKIWKERRRTSSKSGIPFDITLDYLLSLPSETCPVYGTPLEWGTGSWETASLDKINPKLGYVEGNVAWISFRANTLKRDATVEELEKLLNWYKNVSI